MLPQVTIIVRSQSDQHSHVLVTMQYPCAPNSWYLTWAPLHQSNTPNYIIVTVEMVSKSRLTPQAVVQRQLNDGPTMANVTITSVLVQRQLNDWIVVIELGTFSSKDLVTQVTLSSSLGWRTPISDTWRMWGFRNCSEVRNHCKAWRYPL